jgi:hypothetical protein
VREDRIFSASGTCFASGTPRCSEEGRLFGGSGVEPDCAFVSRIAGRAWCTTHGAAGEGKRLFLDVTAEHCATEDDVTREANER